MTKMSSSRVTVEIQIILINLYTSVLRYLLLLLLDREGGGLKVKEEEWTKGMEAVYRFLFIFKKNKQTKDMEAVFIY